MDGVGRGGASAGARGAPARAGRRRGARHAHAGRQALQEDARPPTGLRAGETIAALFLLFLFSADFGNGTLPFV